MARSATQGDTDSSEKADDLTLAPAPVPDGESEDGTGTDVMNNNVLPVVSSNGEGNKGDLYTVIARSGVNLRTGPGTQFSIARSLPLGTSLYIVKREGDWALVDLQGDGAADGHVLASFLKQDAAPASPSEPAVSTVVGTQGLDVATLQTIMNKCAGVKIKSKLDLDEVVYALNKAMTLAGAVTKLRQVAFLSQAVIETDYFRTYQEYGQGRGKDYAPYYGRGIHQLTWKETYRACSHAVFQDDRLVNDPDLILKDIEVNVKATAWYWRDYKPFNRLADARDVDGIIHLLYGGTINSPNPAVRKSVILRRGYYTTIESILA